MPIKFDDGSIMDHKLINTSNISIGTTIQNMDSISAESGKFKDIKIAGHLEIDGKIHADKIEMTETQVVLNLDYDKITDYMNNMDSQDLEFFIRHLHKLKLMAEKELLDRS